MPVVTARSYRAQDGAELHFLESGPPGAFPVVLVHGWLGDATVWEAVAADLAQDVRVVAVDLRGAGRSRRAAGPYVLEQFASDLSDLVRAFPFDPALVVGHSMGGAVALRFALDDPSAVEALLLLAPTPPGGLRLAPATEAMLRALPGNPERIAAWLRKLTVEEPEPRIVHALRLAAGTIAPAVALEMFDAWTQADFAADAATIEQPALVIAGERDRTLPPALLDAEIVQPMPSARLEVLAGVAHHPAIERPDEIARRIRRAIEEL